LNTVSSYTDRCVAWLTEFVIRQHLVLLGLALLATAISYRPAQTLKLDETIESFFAPEDPLLQEYLASKRRFGGDEFVLVAYSPQHPDGEPGPVHVTSNAILEENAAFAAALSQLPGVNSASTQSLKKMIKLPKSGFGLELNPRIRRLVNVAILKQARGILVGGENDETLAIVLRLLPAEQAPIPRRDTIRQIRELAARHQPRTYVAGEPVQVQDMFLYVEQDSRILGVTSTSLLMLIIMLMFRSLRWMILPLLVVQPALLWTKGLLSLTGMKLSMVTSMLTSLTTICGVAVVMHIAVEYRETRLQLSRVDAFRHVFHKLAIPVFWVVVTTAIGFGSLMTSDITPVRSFGLMLTVSSMLVLVACFAFLPAGILLGKRDADPQVGRGEERLVRGLERLFDTVTRRRWTSLVLLLVLTGLACVGIQFVRVETDFSQNFRQHSPIVQAIDYFETRFGGVGTWEVNFSAPAVLEEDYIDRVRHLAEQLRELGEASDRGQGADLTKVVALSDIPRVLSPDLQERLDIMRQMQPEFESTLYNAREGRMRIMLRSRERQQAGVKLKLIQQVRALARETFPDAEVTGLYVLLANVIQSLLRDQLVSFGLSLVLMVVSVWIPFRRMSWALIAMVPNVLPTLWLIGGMGWLGLPINIGTAMIASVSLGLTIDASIHYLAGYRHALQAGQTHRQALREASTKIGQALVLSNAALVLGFSVLALSNFIPLVYFGLLVSFTMVSGLLGNLVLLPSMMLGLKEVRNEPLS
jgi:uncharacterized protein